MNELSLTTPSLLFSAISLILLAYTNRFLSYAAVVRALKDQAEKEPTCNILPQIRNLHIRLQLVKLMQTLGALSFLSCVFTMVFIYISLNSWAVYSFFFALLLLAASLVVCMIEIHISVKALEINLESIGGKKALKAVKKQ